MIKIFQPFIINKAEQLLEILKDDIECTERSKIRLCEILTKKFVQGDIDSETPICEILEKEEILSYINECCTYQDLMRLMDIGLIDSFDDNETFFLTEKGKKYVQELSSKNII